MSLQLQHAFGALYWRRYDDFNSAGVRCYVVALLGSHECKRMASPFGHIMRLANMFVFIVASVLHVPFPCLPFISIFLPLSPTLFHLVAAAQQRCLVL